MGTYIGRREFIIALGGAAAAWPVAARAQQPIGKIRRLGVLLPGPPESSFGNAMRDRLRELGYTEGRDLILEIRWAEGKVERLTERVNELSEAVNALLKAQGIERRPASPVGKTVKGAMRKATRIAAKTVSSATTLSPVGFSLQKCRISERSLS